MLPGELPWNRTLGDFERSWTLGRCFGRRRAGPTQTGTTVDSDEPAAVRGRPGRGRSIGHGTCGHRPRRCPIRIQNAEPDWPAAGSLLQTGARIAFNSSQAPR